jgi:hypothetical protein
MRASLLLCAASAACAATDPDPEWLTRKVAVETAAARTGAFDVPPALQLGFDALQTDSGIAVGDRVLLGVRMDRDGEVVVRFVQAEVVAFAHIKWPPGSGEASTGELRRARVHATVLGADGEPLSDDTLVLGMDELERGLLRACCAGPPTAAADDAEFEALRAIDTLRKVLSIVRRSQALRDLLWQVVDLPSVFSVIWHLGVTVLVAENFAGSQPGAAFAVGDATVPTWTAPIELRLNGAPALRCRVRCTGPGSPLALCAGIVELRAASPSHPQRTVTMQLLGARRGAQP